MFKITLILTVVYEYMYKKFFVHDISIIFIFNAIIISSQLLSGAFSEYYPDIMMHNIFSCIAIITISVYLREYFLKK